VQFFAADLSAVPDPCVVGRDPELCFFATCAVRVDGRAIVRLRLKKQDPVGTYQVLARTTQGSLTGQAATSFRVD
jgi:hypothetical protein